jgi:hypothetical protein
MTYNLPGGVKIIATRIGYDTEFETRNVEGETISTVVRGGYVADNMIAELRRREILRTRGF